jgi:hypothetical protein
MFLTRHDDFCYNLCDLCAKRFDGADCVDGAVTIMPSIDADFHERLALACPDCCPGKADAERMHAEKPWYIRWFTRLDYKLDNFNALWEVARLRKTMESVREIKKLYKDSITPRTKILMLHRSPVGFQVSASPINEPSSSTELSTPK